MYCGSGCSGFEHTNHSRNMYSSNFNLEGDTMIYVDQVYINYLIRLVKDKDRTQRPLPKDNEFK